MAHGITQSDSMMSVRRVPWHGLGVVLEQRPHTLDEALEAAGLTWTVAKQPIHLADGRRIDGHHATVREDTGAVLGVVGDDYVVVQNRECFAFLANLLGSELIFETAGSLWAGRQVFITAELPDHITVGGDDVRPYVVLSAWHTGTGAIRAMTTPVRAVCNNTVRAALERAHAVYRVRHVGDPTAQLHEARAVLGMTVDYYASSPPSATGSRSSRSASARWPGCSTSSTRTTLRSAAGRWPTAARPARPSPTCSAPARRWATRRGRSGARGTRSSSSTTTTRACARARAPSCARSRTPAGSRAARST